MPSTEAAKNAQENSQKELSKALPEALSDMHDAALLDIIQTGFPLVPRPYAEIGKILGLSEEESLARVKALRDKGIIRRLGANFHSKALGFRSSLCAAKVPQEKLEAFVSCVNAYGEVTHNYLREHSYNVWFTLIAPSWEKLCAIVEEITQKTEIDILNLPATRLYKIRVDFKMQKDDFSEQK